MKSFNRIIPVCHTIENLVYQELFTMFKANKNYINKNIIYYYKKIKNIYLLYLRKFLKIFAFFAIYPKRI